jgi:hypothetical protein
MLWAILRDLRFTNEDSGIIRDPLEAAQKFSIVARQSFGHRGSARPALRCERILDRFEHFAHGGFSDILVRAKSYHVFNGIGIVGRAGI